MYDSNTSVYYWIVSELNIHTACSIQGIILKRMGSKTPV